jgi:predicted RNA-binding Zn-ribbon protein involved in translation (DUF1610 family)
MQGQIPACNACGAELKPAPGPPKAGPAAYICPGCGEVFLPASDRSIGSTQALQRFRSLTRRPLTSFRIHPSALDVLDQLPQELRARLLEISLQGTGTPTGVREDLAASLRDQGYVIDQDVHGLRISGRPISRGAKTGQLTPYDVVRLAADLDGGPPSPEQVIICPACQAASPVHAARCQWCGEPLAGDP